MHTSQLIKPGYVEQVVYYDSSSVYTGLTSGTSAKPVNNETDMRAICIARNIKTVVLRGTATILKFTSTLSNMNFEGEGVFGATPTIDFNGQIITCPFTNLIITDTAGGNLVSVSNFANCYILKPIAHTVGGSNYFKCVFASPVTNPALGIINLYDNCVCLGNMVNTTGKIYVYGDFYCAGSLSHTTGTITIRGDCHVNVGISHNGTGHLYVYGNCYVGTELGNTTGHTHIYGNCQVGGTMSNTTGQITVSGSCQVGTDLLGSDTGSITISADCHIGSDLNNATGNITIQGNCQVGGWLYNDTGHVYVYGVCQIANDMDNEHLFEGGTIRFMSPDPTLDLILSATASVERVVSRGNLTVARMVAGATAIIDLCGGVLTLAVTCTGGAITLYGDCGIHDDAGLAVTINDFRVPGHFADT